MTDCIWTENAGRERKHVGMWGVCGKEVEMSARGRTPRPVKI